MGLERLEEQTQERSSGHDVGIDEREKRTVVAGPEHRVERVTVTDHAVRGDLQDLHDPIRVIETELLHRRDLSRLAGVGDEAEAGAAVHHLTGHEPL